VSTAVAATSFAVRANDALAAAARRLAALAGWRRALAALLSGAGAALAFAPFYALPLIALGFSALVFLLDGATAGGRPRRAAFATGWFFGFGYFLVSVYWMAFSFFVQADEFAWMAPFAVLGMPAFLALFSGGACAVAAGFWSEGWRRTVVFAAVWMVFEYARGHILTGLPWNLPGQALAGAAVGAQSAAWYGVYGLSLVVMLLAVAPAFSASRILRGAAIGLAGAAVLFTLGAVRLALLDPGARDDVFVRIVQPNIPQREKIDGAYWGRNFQHHLALSRGETPGRLYVLWPENAAPLVGEYPDALAAIAEALPKNAVLVTGTVRREEDESGVRYFNSIATIAPASPGRAVAGYYDKHHLVPFGEYLPLQGLLRAVGLAQLAPYEDGFTPGAGPSVMQAPGGPAFSPLICYEAIFPGEIYPKATRPEWLVTVTNDAWFGDTSGPGQHLDQAKLRSIETGLPMARSANTGVSALIDARGRLVGRVRLYREGRIDAPLPRALPPTLYSRIGDVGFLLLVLVVLVVGHQRPDKRERLR
jgi:apolipoprotein N-acyltransferase